MPASMFRQARRPDAAPAEGIEDDIAPAGTQSGPARRLLPRIVGGRTTTVITWAIGLAAVLVRAPVVSAAH
ncbi:hypothetical protein [Kutzneria sp. NPDC052558]|uniref:hypothetical protein n=1 Tax=Kutzneria sp. NPDC052558 TaxID=3364121 RepID=UPI0037CAB412